MPTIIRYAGVVEPGTESDAITIGMDWFVTLAKIGGNESQSDFPTRKTRPILPHMSTLAIDAGVRVMSSFCSARAMS